MGICRRVEGQWVLASSRPSGFFSPSLAGIPYRRGSGHRRRLHVCNCEGHSAAESKVPTIMLFERFGTLRVGAPILDIPQLSAIFDSVSPVVCWRLVRRSKIPGPKCEAVLFTDGGAESEAGCHCSGWFDHCFCLSSPGRLL